MNSVFPRVTLGTFLKRTDRFETREYDKEYQFAGTYSFARGIFVGERKMGSSFKLDKIQRIHEGDFVYCKIMAWEGAFGLVPIAADNAVLSGAFVAYEIDQTRVDPRYLEYYFKIQSVWKSIGSQSTGTNVRRRSLDPLQFEAATIPLPPLAEQQRIVARIEALAVRIAEARGLRQAAVAETERIVPALLSRELAALSSKYPSVPLLHFCDFKGGSQPPKSQFRYEPTPGYVRFLQIRDFSSDEYLTYIPVSPQNRMVQPEEVLIGRYGASLGKILRGKEGAYNVAMCKAVPINPQIELDYLAIALGYGPFQERLKQISRSAQVGFNKRDLKGVEYAIPPLPEQRRIVAYLDDLQARVDALRALQAATAAELDALLPAVLDKAFRGEL